LEAIEATFSNDSTADHKTANQKHRVRVSHHDKPVAEPVSDVEGEQGVNGVEANVCPDEVVVFVCEAVAVA